jgi:cob(I)alamin adenosyltransferase
MTSQQAMQQIDTLLSHVWMVRTFIKHSEEAEEDDELRDVQRGLYDFMLALGGPLDKGDAEAYLKTVRKKLSKLRRTTELFLEIQPEISEHTNFHMASRSLAAAVQKIEQILRD